MYRKSKKYNCLRIELVKNSGTPTTENSFWPGIYGDVQLRKFFGLKSAQFQKFKTLQKILCPLVINTSWDIQFWLPDFDLFSPELH